MSLFLTKLLHSRRNQTIADQIMVSGSNFATGVILVRGLGWSNLASSRWPMR